LKGHRGGVVQMAKAHKASIQTHYSDRLSEEQKQEIKAKYKRWKRGALAKEYGFTRLEFNFIAIELGCCQ
jgi:hypothetical protein